MKNKGFTLVELLAVIVVLAVILAIAIPSVLNIIEQSRKDVFTKSEDMLANAAKTYLTSNNSLLPTNIGESSVIYLTTLVNEKIIESIKDPRDNSECNKDNSVVKIYKIGDNKYQYDAYLECTNYQTDITNPDIVATVNGTSVGVKVYDESGFTIGKNIVDRVVLPSATVNGLSQHTLIARIKINAFNNPNSLLNIYNNICNSDLYSWAV